MDNDSFDFGLADDIPELGPEPKTPLFTPSQGRGEPGTNCYTCGVEFASWKGTVTLRDYLTLCRLCLHLIDSRIK